MKGIQIFSIIAMMFTLTACGNKGQESQACSHIWDGCICKVCGEGAHVWEGDACVKCGASRIIANPWRIKSYCGVPAEVDLYIQFKADETFLILQRSGSFGYAEFGGRYSIDAQNYIISGTYFDGESWACDYRFSITENNELILESVTENPEISVYEPAEMPNLTKSRARLADIQDVKPL